MASQIVLHDTYNNSQFSVSRERPLRIYICGPTVYTHTHVGHLKTYMTFDVLRRVIEDHFGVPIFFMMNITNVDDKIIRGTYQKEYKLPDNYNLSDLPSEKYLPNDKFIDFANHWESDFFRVMDKMGIKRPNVVSRVTEYVDEILEFVEEIDKRGYAFEHDGSVYFYGTKYDNIKKEGESVFSQDPEDPRNFVLLKKTRPYEPGWSSKWGSVRPGWHIECSAMASSIFGEHMDIHAGGVDLQFPHHHNELLQSNARFDLRPSGSTHGWVEHFMHTGHLNIEGSKMSRSLKNFITVEEIAKTHTPDQLRMLFLLHMWNTPMDYSDETIKHAIFYTNLFTNFFVQTNSILLRSSVKQNKKFTKHETDASTELFKTKMQIDEKLSNNIDTPSVIKLLHELTSYLFKYVTTLEGENEPLSKEIITNFVDYVRRILNMFGLTIKSNDAESDSSTRDALLKVIADIRTELRSTARVISNRLKPIDQTMSKELSNELYKLTDTIRDKMLPEIGIKLIDK